MKMSHLLLQRAYYVRLLALSDALKNSLFFKSHEVRWHNCQGKDSKNMFRCIADMYTFRYYITKYLYPLTDVWPTQVIGSSLLFVHDHRSRAGVWMIDFGRTTPVPGTRELLHNVPWTEGSGEDGYLIGLTSLIAALSQAVDMADGQEQDGSIGEKSDSN